MAENDYFQEALSDFLFDMASGGAIRQMANRGYSVDQIMKSLDFPTPRDRVEQTVYKHLLSVGILLERLPAESDSFQKEKRTFTERSRLSQCLYEHMKQNDEEHSYLLCPFGEWKKNHRDELEERLLPLSGREREYIMGIPFARSVMYHRLTGRMYEIAVKLVMGGTLEGRFYFLKEQLALETTVI